MSGPPMNDTVGLFYNLLNEWLCQFHIFLKRKSMIDIMVNIKELRFKGGT